MSKLIIEGGHKLEGEISVHGAKNSALPVLAATMLCQGQSVIHNCPGLSDVEASVRILRHLGCKIQRDGSTLAVDSRNIVTCDIPDELMREMRSSIVFLGAIVSRMGCARLSFPGGCELGPRPIDLHLKALRQMGLLIDEQHGYLDCKVKSHLKGAHIALSFPSVGATENIMLAAVLAKGTTVITNAAREPEIIDLANYLNACGGKITGAGGGVVTIDGVAQLHGTEHTVIPDRIAATTFLTAAAITGSKLGLKDIDVGHLSQVIPMFEEAGCIVRWEGARMEIASPRKLHPIKIVRTMPYPGFPTDAQAPVMAMATLASGTSVFVENIFESRYKHAGELLRMGANIKVEGKVAVVEGVQNLYGAQVEAPDLRGGAALVVAGLAAEGATQLTGLHHIDRGYESMEHSLTSIGAKVRRI
ncbi:MAG: UDP-N-acetylglucosamine 1-carboxyvinyltransferase [Clostridiales bacterium]|nr:UDP-N-acetylglucosamine 1-carboxyvinyltransferase [Clostridiales bacterium]